MLTFDYVLDCGEIRVDVKLGQYSVGQIRESAIGELMFYPKDWMGFPEEDLQQIVEKINQLNSGENL